MVEERLLRKRMASAMGLRVMKLRTLVRIRSEITEVYRRSSRMGGFGSLDWFRRLPNCSES